jgi:hypothetical protein
MLGESGDLLSRVTFYEWHPPCNNGCTYPIRFETLVKANDICGDHDFLIRAPRLLQNLMLQDLSEITGAPNSCQACQKRNRESLKEIGTYQDKEVKKRIWSLKRIGYLD